MSLWTELMDREFELRHVDVKGIKTRSLRMGSGTPVIFLHGVSGHIEAFMRTAPYHADHFDVHLIDMLGHGYTDKPDVVLTIDVLAQHVLDYMDVQGIEKAHVCGISMGGWCTGWLLAHHSERLLRSTMIAAAGSPAMGTPEVAKLVEGATRKAVESNDREDTRARLEQVIYNKEFLTEEIIDVRYTIYHQPEFRANIDNLLGQVKSYHDYMLTPELLGGIDQEVLLAWAEEDAWSSMMGAQHFVDNLKHRKLAIFEKAGHWPPYERAKGFADVNIAFLKGGLSAIEEKSY